MSPLYKALAAAALIAALLFGYSQWSDSIARPAHAAGMAEVQARWDQANLAAANVAAKAAEHFRQQERRDAVRASEIENESRRKEKTAAAAVAGAAAAAGGLSGDIAAFNAAARGSGLPTAAAFPGQLERERTAAIAARTALDQCAGRYQAVAGIADGLELKFSTALTYIGLVTLAQP
jgi:hypothetical protein